MNIAPNAEFTVSKPKLGANLSQTLASMAVGDSITLVPYSRSIRVRASALNGQGRHYVVQIARNKDGDTGARVTRLK